MRRFDELTRAVLEGRGALPPALRQAVFDARAEDGIPPAVAAYVAKVAERAYSVTDADVDGLRQAGFNDDQIFELTVAAAVGAGVRRLAAGRAALDGGGWRAMRLLGVERGQPHRRLQLALMGTVFEGGVPDIVKVRYYRPRFFGKPLFRLAQALLRGPSPWTVGERELFGAFVSVRNQCPFWTSAHGAVASLALGEPLTRAVLDDWRTAPIDERLRAALGFVEKLTLTPTELGPADADAARRAGVSDEDLRDAIHVAALFCVIDRVADALGFAVPTGADLARTAKFLLRAGYR